MKKIALFSTLALALLAPFTLFTACKKSPPSTTGAHEANPAAPGAPTASGLETTFGLACKLPSDTPAFGVCFGGDKMWKELRGSNFGTLLGTWIQKAKASKPDADRDAALGVAEKIMTELQGPETVLAVGPGFAESMIVIRGMQQEMQFANFSGAFMAAMTKQKPDPSKTSQAQLAVLFANIDKMKIPSMLMMVRPQNEAATLRAKLAEWETKLPVGVEKSKFQAENGPEFTVLRAPFEKVVPAEAQAKLFETMKKSAGNDADATKYLEALKKRVVELCYAYDGGIFYLALGADHSHVRFASNAANSVVARPEFYVVLNHPALAKPMRWIDYTSKETIAILMQPQTLGAMLAKAAPDLEAIVGVPRMTRLKDGIAKAEADANAAFVSKFDAAVCMGWMDQGIHADNWGGFWPATLSSMPERKLDASLGQESALWINSARDPKATASMFKFVADVASLVYTLGWEYAAEQLPPAALQQARATEQLALPKLQELFAIVRDWQTIAVGRESALTMQLDGEIPALPMVPPDLAKKRLVPRIAAIFDIADKAKLGELWQRTTKLGNDLAIFMPPQAGMANGMPQPTPATLPGVTLYSYPLPMETGDLLPNLGITDSGFQILSTSPDFTQSLATKLAAPHPSKQPAAFEVYADMTKWFDCAEGWLKVAPTASPTGGDILPKAAEMLGTLRPLKTLEVRRWLDGQTPRTSMYLRIE